MYKKVWWLGTHKGHGNFGDVLTPFILDHFKFNYTYTPSFSEADIISTGSIIRRAQKNTSVLGSGLISLHDKINPAANFVFVRGPLTRKKILDVGGTCSEFFGDPGILLPLIYKKNVKKEYKLGIAPHMSDYVEVLNQYKNNNSVNVIKLRTRNVTDTLDEFMKCEKIMSSSLHGIIISHSYGIPAGWFIMNKLKGDNIKFNDYFASVDLHNVSVSSLQNPKYFLPKKIDNKKVYDRLAEFLKD